MYQPISFNVIRQALAWHGFPVPQLRQLSYSPANEDGLATAEYLATWGHSLIDAHYAMKLPHGGSRAQIIYHDLMDCFMDDIQVLSVGYAFESQCYTALLYVTVTVQIGLWGEMMGL